MSSTDKVVVYLKNTLANIERVLQTNLTISQIAKLYGFAEKLQLKYIDQLQGDEIRVTRKEFVRRCNAILDNLEERNISSEGDGVSSFGESSVFVAIDFGTLVHSTVYMACGINIDMPPMEIDFNVASVLCSLQHRLIDDGLLDTPSSHIELFTHDCTSHNRSHIQSLLRSDTRLSDSELRVRHLHTAAGLSINRLQTTLMTPLFNPTSETTPTAAQETQINQQQKEAVSSEETLISTSGCFIVFSQYLSATEMSVIQVPGRGSSDSSSRKCPVTVTTLHHDAVITKDKHAKQYFQTSSLVIARFLRGAAAVLSSASEDIGDIHLKGVWFVGSNRQDLYSYLSDSLQSGLQRELSLWMSAECLELSSLSYEGCLPGLTAADEYAMSGLKMSLKRSEEEGQGKASQDLNDGRQTVDKACTMIGVRSVGCCGSGNSSEFSLSSGLDEASFIPFIHPNSNIPSSSTHIVHTHMHISAGDMEGRYVCVGMEVVEAMRGVYSQVHSLLRVDITLPLSACLTSATGTVPLADSAAGAGKTVPGDVSTARAASSSGSAGASADSEEKMCHCKDIIQLGNDSDVVMVAVFLEVTIIIDNLRGLRFQVVPMKRGAVIGAAGSGETCLVCMDDVELSCNVFEKECREASCVSNGQVFSLRTQMKCDKPNEVNDEVSNDLPRSVPETLSHIAMDGVVWICESVSTDFKVKGNRYMKQLDYFSAVEMYSHAISADSFNGVLYSNRYDLRIMQSDQMMMTRIPCVLLPCVLPVFMLQ